MIFLAIRGRADQLAKKATSITHVVNNSLSVHSVCRFMNQKFKGNIFKSNVNSVGQVAQAARALDYGLDSPGSIPGVGGVEIFLHSFVSRLVLGSTQPPIN